MTSNSHTVSYTYISMWMLYLKCHYPHEFYASLLSCESSIDKIKEYKIESKVHGVQINYLDINKSGINFELKDNDIYYGFSKIKGIGEEPAKRIVAEQPYQSFEDFLTRFGTDASVLKPVIGLRCFKERDPITLWKFAEHFKDCFKKIEEKKKRFINSMDRYEVEFKELVPNETRLLSELAEKDIENPFDSEYWNSLFDKDEETEIIKEVKCDKDTEGAVERTFLVDVKLEDEDIFIQREEIRYFCKKSVKKVWNRWKVLRKLWQKRNKSIELYKRIESLNLPNLAEFDPNEFEINDVLLKEFRDIIACEEKYYGFAWIHELEKSPDYKGFTFDAIKDAQIMGPVEFVIKKVVTNKSKKGVEYKQVFGEDVTGKENKINIWAEDWSRWHQELKAGNLIRARLQPPSGGFNTYLLESNQAGKWRGQLKYVNKDDDPRVVIMKKGQQEEEIILSDDEAFDLFSNLGA